MASINSDIRVRGNNIGRFAAIILGVAALALSIAFGVSLIPAQAEAFGGHSFHWGGYHVQHGSHFNVHNHGYHHVGHHNHDNDDESETGTLNIVIVVDNSNGTGEATVADFAANVFENGSETPTAGSPFMDGDSTDIDEGTNYDVVLDAPQEGYDVSYSEGCTGTMSEDADVTCTITNTDVAPVTPECGETQHLDVETNQCVDNTPVVPVCNEGQHLDAETNVCVNDTPVDPICLEGQHLDNHLCVANPAPETPSNGGSNGGNGGGNGGGGVVGNGPFSLGYVTTNNGGQVLGASTDAPSCGVYLTSYLKFGGKNNTDQVKKLQNFLNTHMNAGLTVSGTFDQATFDAVKAFQVKYSDTVLSPWVKFGLQNDKAATGYVYKTTLRMINLINCSTLNLPQPQLP